MSRKCHVCGEEIEEDEGYRCSDCGERICDSPLCGDGDMCSLCIGDEIFLADILGFEE